MRRHIIKTIIDGNFSFSINCCICNREIMPTLYKDGFKIHDKNVCSDCAIAISNKLNYNNLKKY